MQPTEIPQGPGFSWDYGNIILVNKIIVETERLILREGRQSDKDFILILLNTPKWLKYIGDRGIKTLKDAEEYINKKLIQNYHTNGYGFYIMELKESQIPIGICGFVKREYLDSKDMGFAILSEYERRGYTYEASLAILNYGENQLGFTKIYAITSKDNFASQELLKKLGFGYTSTIIEPLTDEELSLFSKEDKRL